MQEIECTADLNGGDQPNILFTPPCACPRCKPDELVEPDGHHLWHNVDGKRVRSELVNMELGAFGRQLLG